MNTREDIWATAMKAERQGDVSAYEHVLADIARTLRMLIRSRLSRQGLNPHETEDIVQEVLIGLHTMRRRWDPERPFMPWLHAIVRYKLSDAVRRRRREARYRCDLTLDDWNNVAEAPGDGADRAFVDLDRHLGHLSAAQRDVVRALAVEGATVRDTALRLQTSEGAVRVTLHRALQRLAAIANLGTSQQGKSRI